MQKRKLGNSGLEIAPLMFGGNVFGWTIDESTSFRLLDGFVDAGFNGIDTADVYSNWKPGNSGGESETIIGKWLAQNGKRDKVVIASKVGIKMTEEKKGLSKNYILQAIEDSLRRLKTDYIDLYQSHTDDLETPLEETLETYSQVIKQGKVRAIGASNYTSERLSLALEISKRLSVPVYETLQPRYNLYDRDEFEPALAPLCQKMGVSVIPYSSLGSGFLTGKYRSESDFSKSLRGPRITKYLNERGFRILDALDTVAKQLSSTPGNVAIAWLLTRPAITAPIASATSMEQLLDLTKAVELHLDSSHIDMLNQASAQ